MHEDILCKTLEEAKGHISIALKKYKSDEFFLLKYIRTSKNMNLISYIIAKFIAQQGRLLPAENF
jgi:hypothetical protein